MTRRQDIIASLLARGIGIVEADTIRASLHTGGPVSAGTHVDLPMTRVSFSPPTDPDVVVNGRRDEAIRRLAEALDVPLELIATPHYPTPDDMRTPDDMMVFSPLPVGGIRPARYDLPDGFRWSDAGLFVYPGAPVEEPETTIVWQARVMPGELERMNLTPLERFRWENQHARHAIEREDYVPGPMHAYRLDDGVILLEWEGHR